MAIRRLGSYGRLADNPFPTEKSRISHRLGGGVYYTGRKDLQLGVSYYSVLGLSEALQHRVTQSYSFSSPRHIDFLQASVVKTEIKTLAPEKVSSRGMRRCFLNEIEK